jgi:hypothetical protein
MELTVVPITKPDAANFIFGQSHFIKTGISGRGAGHPLRACLLRGLG